jgi:hypothetical protein
MRLLVLHLLVLGACAKEGSNAPTSATPMPVVSTTGPNIVTANIRCSESRTTGAPSMSFFVESSTADGNDGNFANAFVMVETTRMVFEAFSYTRYFLAEIEPRSGQEAAMREVCDQTFVELLDVRVTDPSGTTVVPSLVVPSAWQ